MRDETAAFTQRPGAESGAADTGEPRTDDTSLLRRALDRLGRLQEVTAALSGSLTLAQVAEVIVAQGVAAMDARAGIVVLLTEDRSALKTLRAQGYSEEALAPWLLIPLDTPLPLTDAVRRREPVLLESLAELHARYPEMAAYAALRDGSDDGSWAAVPLIAQGRVLGALGLTFPMPQRFGADDAAFLLALAHQCAQAMERARLYEDAQHTRQAAESERRRLAFLIEASTALAATLDYRATLASVARLAVPRLADWAAVDMLTEDGRSIERLAVAHVDPAKVAWAADLQRKYPSDLNEPTGLGRVLRTGQIEFLPEITDAMLVAAVRSEEQLADARAIGFASYLCVPLAARGRILGAITLVTTTESGRHFTSRDVTLAQDLASRAALAVDNARLYEEARRERAEAETVLESVTDAFYAVDREWRFAYVNRRAEAYLGRPRAELLGTSVWDVVPRALGTPFETQYRHAMTERVAVDFEAYSPHSQRWQEVHAYPSARGLSVYFRDVTERHEAEEERRAAARARRVFVQDVLASVTEGRLQLCYAPEELPAPLPPFSEPVSLSEATLKRLRKEVHGAAAALGFPPDRTHDIVTAASEAAMNAVRHAGGGIAQVRTAADTVQIWVEDQGAGIAMERLPRATLEPGYSDAGGLGHGFWLMLQTADCVFLLTGPSGTTVVLEQGRASRGTPPWLATR